MNLVYSSIAMKLVHDSIVMKLVYSSIRINENSAWQRSKLNQHFSLVFAQLRIASLIICDCQFKYIEIIIYAYIEQYVGRWFISHLVCSLIIRFCRFIKSLLSPWTVYGDVPCSHGVLYCLSVTVQPINNFGAFSFSQKSLQSLLSPLDRSHPYFVRCIKSNIDKTPCKFDNEFVRRQLRYTGMLATVKLRQSGYNYRVLFEVSLSRLWRGFHCPSAIFPELHSFYSNKILEHLE